MKLSPEELTKRQERDMLCWHHKDTAQQGKEHLAMYGSDDVLMTYLRVSQHMSRLFRCHFGRLQLTFPQEIGRAHV